MPVAVVAVIVVLLLLLFPTAYYYRIGALVFIFALAAVGLDLLMGFAGQVSLGHAGFFGVGAYVVAIGPVYLGLAPGSASSSVRRSPHSSLLLSADRSFV